MSTTSHKLAELARRIPRKASLAMFMGRGGGRFIDNGKYAFLHCHRHVPELTCWFVTTDPAEAATLRGHGLPVLLSSDDGALELLLRAGLVVCDDFGWKESPLLWPVLHTARTMQLWHGIPLKAIGEPEYTSTTIHMTPERAAHLRFAYTGYDAVLSTSPYFTRTAFGRAFGARAFPELGYPRNDALLRPHDALDLINVDRALYDDMVQARQRGTRCVVYMPTFRDRGGTPFDGGAMDIARLDDFARRHDVLFVLKLHPYVAQQQARLTDRVRVADALSDAYPLLAHCDALITDYSSIYFDYLLLDRPMLFYPYDYDDYVSRNRELLYDYGEMTPGTCVRTQDALYDALADMLDGGQDPWREARARLRALAFTHQDGKAAERLGRYLVEQFATKGARA